MASPAMAKCFSPSLFENSPIETEHDANEFAAGDLDNDGETDLVTVSTSEGTIHVRLGNGDNTFDSVLPYTAPSPEEVALGDLNNDGFADIVVSSEPGTNPECISFGGCAGFSVLLNDGDGTFGPATTTVVPFSSSIVSIEVANFDDGNRDVLVGAPPINSTDPALHVFFGNGTGAFPTRNSWSVDGQGTLYDAEPYDPYGAGFSSVVAIAGPGSTSSFTRALIYANASSTLVGNRVVSTDPVVDGELAMGDFDRNGVRDIAAMTRTATQSNISTWLQETFTSSSGLGYVGFLTDLAIADGDEDGDLDIMVTQSSNDWFAFKMNDHLFEVQPAEGPFFDTDAVTTRVIANDLNRDGRIDYLFLDTGNDVVRIMSNTCTERYASITLNSSPNPSTFGSDATFTVSVQGRENAGVPTGNVTLYEGSTVRGTGTLNDAGNAFITLSNLTVGSHTLHAVYEGDGGFGAQTSADYVHTVSAPPFGPPPNVTATGNGAANQITITWTPTSNTSSYDVLRRENGAWVPIASVGGPPYVDTNVVSTSAYVYRIRAHHTNTIDVADSSSEIATTATLLLPLDRKIRATDLTTTRSLIDSLRSAAGLGTFTFTDASLSGVNVKAVHFTELRDALNPARTALGLAPITYTNTITLNAPVRAVDVQEIRNSMQ